MNLLLDTMLTRYRQELSVECVLRANVMKVRKTKLRFHAPLRIDYKQGSYSASELSQAFAMGAGCCGWCFEVNEQTTYDRIKNQEALRGMTAEQREATNDVHSILSTPIYRPGNRHEAVVILNVDSPQPIGETQFYDAKMQDLVAGFAAVIGTVLR